ncbi:hypothetical protein BGAL_0006g00720 [Botrytis galanthina]|uniref:Large ribosomal subunit protein mL59 domain-containing protein n=1 Tax=Botrytis galanthina TaxID=278940 RepID=A0A4S8RC11_9HELO|nr:hypothetical protein BGAL_0006g00720 [Botrytis galanthina]
MLKPVQYVKLAQSLPPQLQRFFARYPPQAILPQANAVNTTSDAATSEAVSKATLKTEDTLDQPTHPAITEATSPFRPHKHPVTGKWHDPVFSLRRQADLCKLARQHGVEELLPLSVKSTEEKLRKRMENGLRVKGTGVGQRVKGKESERTLKSRLEKRRKAMLEMPQMIQTWKERGHGRGWKKWPK